MSRLEGAMCGGVVSQSYYEQETAKDVWALAMSYVLPDEHFKKYEQLIKDGKRAEANKITDAHAWSVI